MTRDKAIEILEECQDKGFKRTTFTLNDYHTALDMAIKALEQESNSDKDWYDVPSYEMTLGQARQAVKDLRKKLVELSEQEPCGDCISRQAAINEANEDGAYGYISAEELAKLPPVSPVEPQAESEEKG